MWECNAEAVDVFRLCAIGGIGTFGGLYWTGIDAAEIRAACALLRIPRADWPDLAADVHYMGAEVAEDRNKRQERASKRKR